MLRCWTNEHAHDSTPVPSAFRLTLVAATAAFACGEKPERTSAHDADIDVLAASDHVGEKRDEADAAVADGQGGAAACGCYIDPAGYLRMSSECLCQLLTAQRCRLSPEQIAAEYAPGCGRSRTDHPACGLLVLRFDSISCPQLYVFDAANGRLVGVQACSDTSSYRCPSEPSVESVKLRAGRFPHPQCEGTESTYCTVGMAGQTRTN
jgi:hypothetical protein